MVASSSSIVSCRFDHLVICAQSLNAGVDWFAERSGVHLPAGGQHPLMGTHNHLSALGETSFLEIIATDPLADRTAADNARWFLLDNADHQAQLAIAPKLTTWVIATDDLDAALDKASANGIDAGVPVTQTRGDLTWRIALRQDGSMACDGVFPVLIQWPAGTNPVSRMQDQQVRLETLQLAHPDAERVMAGMQALGIAEMASVESGKAGLRATLRVGASRFIV